MCDTLTEKAANNRLIMEGHTPMPDIAEQRQLVQDSWLSACVETHRGIRTHDFCFVDALFFFFLFLMRGFHYHMFGNFPKDLTIVRGQHQTRTRQCKKSGQYDKPSHQ